MTDDENAKTILLASAQTISAPGTVANQLCPTHHSGMPGFLRVFGCICRPNEWSSTPAANIHKLRFESCWQEISDF